MLLHINTMEGNPVPLWVLWATWPEAMLMHSYLALRVENKRWTPKIWGQQTQLSGRDQQTWGLYHYKCSSPCWLAWSYSFPQLFPSFLCLPTITPTCALLLSPTSSLFCLFGVQGLSVRLLSIHTAWKCLKIKVHNFRYVQLPVSGFYKNQVSWKMVDRLCF